MKIDPRTRDAFRAAAVTAAFTFAVLALGGIVGFLAELQSWVSAKGTTPPPDISTLGWTLASAALAGLAGLANFAWRWFQARLGKGNPPTYGRRG